MIADPEVGTQVPPQGPANGSVGLTGEDLLGIARPVRVRSFGPENPGKIFYVIWREKGQTGLFSIVTSTLCHLHIARQLGMVPVVDMEHFRSLYNEDHPVEGTYNSWEYYFKPVSPYSLEEVYNSKTVAFCDGRYPSGYAFWLTEAPELQDVYRSYVRIQPSIEEFVDHFEAENFAGARVLGIHFRGQEFRTTPIHPLPATPRQMITRARELLSQGGYEKIFVVTEEQAYLSLLKRVFGSRVIHTHAFRTTEVNAYEMYARPNHKYLLGLEVLRDALLLGRCNALLCAGSNVAEFAQLYSAGRYDMVSKIDNGLNVANQAVAKRLWFVRNFLPKALGGFPDR
jgi:hypothetical protein